MQAAGIRAPLRFAAVLTDGVLRWASDDRPATLYWREGGSGLVVVSGSIDDAACDWRAVPSGHCLSASPDGAVIVKPLVGA